MIDCRIDRITLKINAVQNESTAKPPTILVHNKIITALMTNKNKPSVITVTGSVKTTKIGFIKTFNNPKTTATITAVPKLATCTPVKILDSNKTKAAVTRSLSNNFIVIQDLNLFKSTNFSKNPTFLNRFLISSKLKDADKQHLHHNLIFLQIPEEILF